MSRPKAVWTARQRGRIRAEGRNLVLPARMADDPTRVVEVRIPASEAQRVILAQIEATGGFNEQLVKAPTNGRSAARSKRRASRKKEASRG